MICSSKLQVEIPFYHSFVVTLLQFPCLLDKHHPVSVTLVVMLEYFSVLETPRPVPPSIHVSLLDARFVQSPLQVQECIPAPLVLVQEVIVYQEVSSVVPKTLFFV